MKYNDLFDGTFMEILNDMLPTKKDKAVFIGKIIGAIILIYSFITIFIAVFGSVAS